MKLIVFGLTQLKAIYSVFHLPNTSPTVQYICPQSQGFSTDCEPFAVANAFYLLSGVNPENEKLQQSELRSHILKCFNDKNFTVFPTERKQLNSSKSMVTNRKGHEYRSIENTKDRERITELRKNLEYAQNENYRRNKRRHQLRENQNYLQQENMKRNKTRHDLRCDPIYAQQENKKRSKTRHEQRSDPIYAQKENKLEAQVSLYRSPDISKSS